MQKVCKVCRQEKEHKSWKSTTCNDCLDKGLKWCSACEIVQHITNFHKNGNTIRSFCKQCEIKRSVESKDANKYYSRPEVRAKRNEDSRLCKRAKYKFDDAYRIAELVRCHSRREQVRGTLTPKQWYSICSIFNHTCAYCGSECNLTMDHIIPLSRGGKTSVYNIVCACQSCNSSKQDKDVIEWYTAQPFYNKSNLEVILKITKKGVDAE